MAAMDEACRWCGDARWTFRCSTCDPRSEKKFCVRCSMLWHSRGLARDHQLTSRFGLTRSYLAWGALREYTSSSNGTTNGFTDTENQVADVGPIECVNVASVVTETQAAVNEEKSAEKLEAKDDAAAPIEVSCEEERVAAITEEVTHQDDEKKVESMEEKLEFEVVGESVDSVEDGDTASAQSDGDMETKEPAEVAIRAADSIVEAPGMGNTAPGKQSNGTQENEEVSSAPGPTDPISSVDLNPLPFSEEASTAQPVVAQASRFEDVSATTGTSVSVADSSASQVTTTTTSKIEIAQAKPVDLEKLLRWFPTTDNVLMDMLAARVEAALVVEDALICARIGKCEVQKCRSTLLHYEHCKRNEVCADPKCFEMSIVYRHRRACLKKDAALTLDGEKCVCPFCIRIRQRRSLGMVAALEHLISDQRRALQSAQSEANRNFCLQSIKTWTQRKEVLRAETDRFNQLARDSSAPIFNFPRYQWHFSDAVLIKREPTLVEVDENTASEPSAAEMYRENMDEVLEAEPSAPSPKDEGTIYTADDEANDHESQRTGVNSMPANVNFNADFINELLLAKAEHGDSREMAQREFNGVMELGYAIVDASFCAPSKAQRCLLNCTSILVHLQHHLDLKVCNQPMCTAVEHHFAHLSQCKARQESKYCEYCLRAEERQLVRSVDVMEVQQPEAEAKVQKIVNDITASFTNHRPDEREQEVIQLEDELEQAEDNKRELSEKISVARQKLRKVRKNLERRQLSTSVTQRLPVHFIKVRRGDGSSGSSKKRRLLGSLD